MVSSDASSGGISSVSHLKLYGLTLLVHPNASKCISIFSVFCFPGDRCVNFDRGMLRSLEKDRVEVPDA